jgi:NADPH:quinone reductase-like Zn-dependent oxidoreductase
MILDGDFHSPLPIIGSHEPCGTVVEVGSAVKGFKKGDRVGSLLHKHPCGECPDCKAGTYNYCDKMEGAMGINCDGAFAEVRCRSTDLTFSILFVIQSRLFIFPRIFHLSMRPLFSAQVQPFTALSKRQISRKGMCSALLASEPWVILGSNLPNAWFAFPLSISNEGVDSRWN